MAAQNPLLIEGHGKRAERADDARHPGEDSGEGAPKILLLRLFVLLFGHIAPIA